MATTLLAGIARADITPPIGIAHANWGAQTHERAAGIDLPLELTALALSDGDATSVIIDIACCWLWGGTAAQVLASVLELTGLPDYAVRLSYTHTHSGPTGGSDQSWVTGGAEMVDSYIAGLGHKAAGAAWAALRDMQRVRIAGAVGELSISVIRRLPRRGDGDGVVLLEHVADVDDGAVEESHARAENGGGDNPTPTSRRERQWFRHRSMVRLHSQSRKGARKFSRSGGDVPNVSAHCDWTAESFAGRSMRESRPSSRKSPGPRRFHGRCTHVPAI